MDRKHGLAEQNPAGGPERFSVILVRPESQENVGIAARGMKNTGFSDLRLVGLERLAAEAYLTAVHAGDILDGARFFSGLAEAQADLNIVFASTARTRRGFPLISLQEAAATIREFPADIRVGLVFGNERTGLTSDEIALSNFRFHIPQAERQPSYNLGVAVTLTLFQMAAGGRAASAPRWGHPLTRSEQESCGRLFRDMLDGLGFMRRTNRDFIAGRVLDIFRRMVLDAKDRDIILAMFRKSLAGRCSRGRRVKANTDKE